MFSLIAYGPCLLSSSSFSICQVFYTKNTLFSHTYIYSPPPLDVIVRGLCNSEVCGTSNPTACRYLFKTAFLASLHPFKPKPLRWGPRICILSLSHWFILKHIKVGEVLFLSLKNWFFIRLNSDANDLFRQSAKLNRFLALMRNPLKADSGEAKLRKTGTLKGRATDWSWHLLAGLGHIQLIHTI